MRTFDLEQLRSLVAVIEEGSLSGAAPRMNRSQSALSEQIQKLEGFAGVLLLQRSKKGVSPTPAGERLLAHARNMLSLSERALEDVRGARLTGELRLAITDYFRPAAIADLLRRLKLRFPELRLHVIVLKSVDIEQEVSGEGYDIGLAMRILDGATYPGSLPLRKEPLVWIAAEDAHPERETPLPMLLLPEGCSLGRYTRLLLEKHNVPYFVAHSASGVAGLQSALVAGLGVACLNASAVPMCLPTWRPHPTLPPLQEVEFAFMPPRAGEPPLVGEVRTMLISEFS